MVTPEHMLTEKQLITLTQWLSPAFPVGSFAYSHGLEGAVEQRWVTDGTSLQKWLEDILEFGGGRVDSTFVAAGYKAKTRQKILEIDQIARAFAPSSERRLEAEDQGRAFGKAITNWGIEADELTYPVILGVAASRENLPLNITQILFLQAFISNLVAAGQRLLSIGHHEGQSILKCLSHKCPFIANETSDGDISTLSSCAFLTDIASMKHETQTTRIFRT